MRYMSRDSRDDRDAILRGSEIEKVDSDELERVPLRNMFVEERVIEIAHVTGNYFQTIRQRWPDTWNFGGKGLTLNQTNVIRAFMKFFRPVYLDLAMPGDMVKTDTFDAILSKVDMIDADFTVDTFSLALAANHCFSNVRIVRWF